MKLKKCFLIFLCVCMVSALAACGMRDTTEDSNMTDHTNSGVNDVTNGDADENRKEDTMNHDDNANNGNVLDDTVDGIADGVDDVTDGMKDAVDDATDRPEGEATKQ